MSSYTNQTKKPEEEILYTGGAVTPTNSVYPTSVVNTGTVGATGGAVTPTASPTGTSGVLYTDGAAALPTDSYGYAEWLRNNSYQNATDLANKARQEALLNKQNALVGADTAYKQGLATYGANAESLASKGLSNSGYGEYLTGKNYATARAEKAAANATYQGAMNDILYQENSAKQSADQLYADKMIQLDEKKKTDAQTAYDALLLSAQSGTDISALQSDARWALMSPDQQNAITAAATEVTRGKTFDEILRNIKVGDYDAETVTSAPGWDTLTDAEKDQALDEIRLRGETYKENVAKFYAQMLEDSSVFTDAYIDNLVTDDYIDKDGAKELKKRRDSYYSDKLDKLLTQSTFKEGDTVSDEFIAVLDDAFYSGYNKDEARKMYDEAMKKAIKSNKGADFTVTIKEIAGYVGEGKLTEAQSSSLIASIIGDEWNVGRLTAYKTAISSFKGVISDDFRHNLEDKITARLAEINRNKATSSQSTKTGTKTTTKVPDNLIVSKINTMK